MKKMLPIMKYGRALWIPAFLCSSALIALALVAGQHSFLHGADLSLIICLIAGVGAVIAVVSVFGLITGTRLLESMNRLRSDCERLQQALLKFGGPSVPPTASSELGELVLAAEELSARLTEAKKTVQTVIERAADVICFVDLEGKLRSVNPACINSWGYEPAELEGLPLNELVTSENHADLLSSVLGASKSISRVAFECRLKRKDGEWLDVIWSGHWSASEGGLFCIVHDITERKRLEEMLKQNELRLRTTLERLPVGVLLLDKNGDTEFSNSSAARMFACSEKQLENDHVSVLDLLDEDVLVAMQDAPEGDQPVNISTRALRADGSTFPVEIRLDRIEFAQSSKLLLVIVDKTAEFDLENLKNQVTSMVVHDLKAPLSSFLGILELYDSGELGQSTEFGRELTARVRADINRTLKLIRSLLELNKIKSGVLRLECSYFKPSSAIERARDSVAPLALKKNIAIDLAVDPASSCYGDEERIIQVLVNLLSNAIKFSLPESCIKIAVEDSAESTRVTVADSGRGLPADKVGAIFRNFEQVADTDETVLGGSGLGLAISKSIIEAHGGKIGVTSIIGEGSTFWFSLPKN